MNFVNQILDAMRPYNIKPEGTAQYRANSPFRAGSDSMSFTIKEVDGGLVWYDHVDEKGGSHVELAQHFGIEYKHERTEIEPTKRAYKDLADYAAAHGVSVDVLIAARWQQVTKEGRKAIEFPTQSGKRWRFIDGNKPWYKSETGYKRCWFGFNAQLLGMIVNEQKPLIICNGEISVVVARHYGLAAICVTAGEKSGIPENLLSELDQWLDQTPVQILVAMDCDAKGRMAANGVARQLRDNGYEARAVDLLLGDGGDLADYCKLHGEQAAQSITALPTLTDETAPPTQLYSMEGVKSVLGAGKTWLLMHAKDRHEIPPVEWIIPGEVVERGLNVLYGPSGVGKSFLVVDYALRIAQHSNVVYMAGEGEGGIPSRIDAWCKHYSKPEGELLLCLGAVSFMDGDDLDTFINTIVPYKPRLVIVDTLSRSMDDADENSTRDMARFMKQCKRLMNKLNAAVMLVHHTGKDGNQERGSYVLRASADHMLSLVDDDDVIQVETSKTKDAKQAPTKYMRLLPIDVGVVDAHGNPQFTPVIVEADLHHFEAGHELTVKQRKVLDAMAMDVFSDGVTIAQLEEVLTGMQRRVLYKVVSRLKQLGYVSQSAPREPYKLSESAYDLLGINVPDVSNVPNMPNVSGEREEDKKSKSVKPRTKGTKGTLGTRTNGLLFNDDDEANDYATSHYNYGL